MAVHGAPRAGDTGAIAWIQAILIWRRFRSSCDRLFIVLIAVRSNCILKVRPAPITLTRIRARCVRCVPEVVDLSLLTATVASFLSY